MALFLLYLDLRFFLMCSDRDVKRKEVVEWETGCLK